MCPVTVLLNFQMFQLLQQSHQFQLYVEKTILTTVSNQDGILNIFMKAIEVKSMANQSKMIIIVKMKDTVLIRGGGRG